MPGAKKVSLKSALILVVAVLLSQCLFAQNEREKWIDSVFQTLNTEEKIGQLIMVRIPSNSEEDQENLFDKIKSYRIGGAIITSGGPVRHARFINKAQKNSRVPMLFGIEATSGVGERIDSVLTFAPPLVLSAVKNDSIVYDVGKAIAEEMKMLGLQINFSPQANFDYRSDDYPGTLMHYSDNKERVQKKSLLFVKALQENGIIACAQHQLFPSNVSKTSKLLYEGQPDKTLFEPYQYLIDNGLKAIRTTRLPYFYVEKKNETLPTKISRIFISEQIKRSLGFTGLTFTDIPELQQIVEKPRGGETEVLAFQVGNDILIDPISISATVKKLKKDLKKNLPLQAQLDITVKKILAAKYDAGLATWQPLNTENLVRRLNPLHAKLLQHDIIRKSITLVDNQVNAVPIQSLENKRFASITIGKELKNDFTHTLSKYTHFDHFALRTPEDTSALDLDVINRYDYVVIGIFPHATSFLPSITSFLSKVKPSQKIFCHFGDPLQLNQFADLNTAIAAYSDHPISEKSAAQMIFGALTFEGELPVSVNHQWMEGRSLSIQPVQRFSYVLPEEAGLDSKTLDQIAYIARQAIDSMGTPGLHVFVARRGKVVYDRSFGWYTYDNKIAVTDETIYDLASITKVAATLQAVMFLAEKGMIDVHKKASLYLPELKNTNKKDMTLKDMLTHQSGLLPFIPMWPNTFDEKKERLPYYYSSSRNDHYSLQVAPELFAAPVIRDSALHWVLNSKTIDRAARTPYPYRYSDMASMLYQFMVERLVNQPMNEFLNDHFYEPLGAATLGFRPLERFDPSRIAPTEIDTIFRKQLIHGTVHDERAAMLGGIAGHAGLFGNANDLGKVGQMLLNKGTYGGVQYFKPETVDLFTTKQYDNSRRGLGWDKPTGDWNSPTSTYASPLTFGHTGFTGTCIWVDPTFDLVFVFLSNRVWPDRSNKLLNANIRTRIQEVVYKSIFNYSQFHE